HLLLRISMMSLETSNPQTMNSDCRNPVIGRLFEPWAAVVFRQKLKTQFRGKCARRFKHPSDFINSTAAPPELFLVAVEPGSFPFAGLGLGTDARCAAVRHPIADRNQKIVRDVNRNGLALFYRK